MRAHPTCGRMPMRQRPVAQRLSRPCDALRDIAVDHGCWIEMILRCAPSGMQRAKLHRGANE